jgi:cytochrome c oxidase subunit IV
VLSIRGRRKKLKEELKNFVRNFEPVKVAKLIIVHEHEETTQAHQVSNLSGIWLVHFVVNQLSHLQNQFLVMVLVRETLFEQLKVQLSRLVVDSQLPHSRHPRLFLLTLYALLLQLFLTFELLL